MTRQPAKRPPRLFDRVAAILEEARAAVVRTVNTRMAIAYWLIGREIVQEKQGGKRRAGYGDALLEDLSRRLTERYGKGYSVANLKNFRQFHLVYADRVPEIRYAPCSELVAPPVDPATASKTGGYEKSHTVRSELPSPAPGRSEPVEELVGQFATHCVANPPLAATESFSGFATELSWTHYRLIMRVENAHARAFYEIEAARERWSSRDLERQINSLLFERLLKSRNKKGVMALAREGNQSHRPVDILKDAFVLEFLELPEGHALVESRLEQALVGHMRQFLLELGCGFAFVARQQRLTLDGDHFYVDLVFYHTRLKCYVLIDLKVGKLTQQDLGQMQLYVNYYDREVCAPDDNPTVGLILCTDRNEAMVRYTLPRGQNQIFAARYRTALPSEEELIKLLRRDWDMVIREQHAVYGREG
jgi:predicted nuclease of restriction endonuclease-like (RecB) superfamily